MAKAKYTYNEKRKAWIANVYDGTLLPSGEKRRIQLISKKSSADLEKKVNAHYRKLEEGQHNTSTILFGDYARNWFELYKANTEKNTKVMYNFCITKYFSTISHVRLCDIKRSHFQQIINENNNHPKTCRNIQMCFKQVIKSAVRDGLLPRTATEDICSDISLPKYVKPVKRGLNALEKEALFKADLDVQKRAFVTLLYYCGLRRGEALALTKNDFDFNKKTVSISRVVIFDVNRPEFKPYPKSDNGIRTIPLHEDAIKILKPYVSSCRDLLFTTQDGNMMTAQSYFIMWNSIITSMNIAVGYKPYCKPKMERPIKKLTAHIFRHNFCTQLCYQVPTISTKKIAQLMGDTEKVVLDVYSHIAEENENVSDALSNAF